MFNRKPDGLANPLENAVPFPPSEKARLAIPPAPSGSSQPHEDGVVKIGKGTHISGNIRDCQTLDVHGVVEADVIAGNLIVRQGGGIKGNVQVENAEIHGIVEGTLTVSGHLDVKTTGNVSGELSYKTLAVSIGARLLGTVHIQEGSQEVDAEIISDRAFDRADRVQTFSSEGRAHHLERPTEVEDEDVVEDAAVDDPKKITLVHL